MVNRMTPFMWGIVTQVSIQGAASLAGTAEFFDMSGGLRNHSRIRLRCKHTHRFLLAKIAESARFSFPSPFTLALTSV